MAIFRPIQISYWQDKFVLKLTPEEKFFYIYLMTNSKTQQCGIYELPIAIISLETGYNSETITKLIKKFAEYKKIKYCFINEEIYLINWTKYNQINNKNTAACVVKELQSVKNADFISEYLKKLSFLNKSEISNLQIEGAYYPLIKKRKPLGRKQTETEIPTEEKEKTEIPSLSPFSKNGKTTFNDDWFDKHIWDPWLNKDCSREEAKEYFIEACVTHETTRDKAWLAAKGVLNYFRSRNVQEGVIMNFRTFFLESDGAKITLWANAPPN